MIWSHQSGLKYVVGWSWEIIHIYIAKETNDGTVVSGWQWRTVVLWALEPGAGSPWSCPDHVLLDRKILVTVAIHIFLANRTTFGGRGFQAVPLDMSGKCQAPSELPKATNDGSVPSVFSLVEARMKQNLGAIFAVFSCLKIKQMAKQLKIRQKQLKGFSKYLMYIITVYLIVFVSFGKQQKYLKKTCVSCFFWAKRPSSQVLGFSVAALSRVAPSSVAELDLSVTWSGAFNEETAGWFGSNFYSNKKWWLTCDVF